jgi:hypothetical protein
LFVGGFYLQLFVGGVMSCLRHLCLLVYNGVEHILCSVFCFICLRLVVCAPNIASFSVLVIRYSLTFIYSLVVCAPNIASFSVLVILDCPVSNVYL